MVIVVVGLFGECVIRKYWISMLIGLLGLILVFGFKFDFGGLGIMFVMMSVIVFSVLVISFGIVY